MCGLLAVTESLSFSYLSILDRLFISDHGRGDVYTVGRLTHAHFLLNARSEIFASRIQLENALKLIF